MNREKVVIDATEGSLGRISSFAAKQALLGKEIIIVNCNLAIVIGRKGNTIAEYNNIRAKGGASLKGPFFPKNPERIVKRTIRGMLDYTGGRGEAALDRVMCYNKVPKEFESSKKISFKRDISAKSITLVELEKVI